MDLTLIRDGSINGVGTTGTLTCDLFTFATIEREWEGNKASISCVPLGKYDLIPYSSDRYPDHYALVNESIGVYAKESDIPEDKKHSGRFAILIHSANLSSQLAGCIAVGLHRGCLKIRGKTNLGVLASALAVSAVFDALENYNKNTLTIEAKDLEW